MSQELLPKQTDLIDRFGVLHRGVITEISKEDGENLEDAYISILNDRMEKICC